jgi:hypothetical protein
MPNERPKLLYRAERHPAFDQSQFTARWRQHATLGMSQARWKNVHRYVHCDPVEPVPPLTGACSGIALIWYRSEEARRAHVADESARRIMRADEAETFARPVRGFSALVREVVLSAARGGAAKCFVFLRRPAGQARKDFQAIVSGAWAEQRLRALSAVPGFLGYAQNLTRPDSAALGFGLDWDLVEEISCAEPCALPALDQNAIAQGEAVWTREVVLHQVDQ